MAFLGANPWSLVPKSICCSQSVGKKEVTKHASDLESKHSVSSVTPHWHGRAVGYRRCGQASAWLAKCSKTGGSAQHQGHESQEHRGWHQLLLFLGSWVSVTLNDKGWLVCHWQLQVPGGRARCCPWRGPAPCGQGLSGQGCSLFGVQSKAAKRSMNFPASQYTCGAWIADAGFAEGWELLVSDTHLQLPDVFLLSDVYFS